MPEALALSFSANSMITFTIVSFVSILFTILLIGAAAGMWTMLRIK